MSKFRHDFTAKSNRMVSKGLKISADLLKFFENPEGFIPISQRLKTVREKRDQYVSDKFGLGNASGLNGIVPDKDGNPVSLLDADIRELMEGITEWVGQFELTPEMEKELPGALKRCEARIQESVGYHKFVSEMASKASKETKKKAERVET